MSPEQQLATVKAIETLPDPTYGDDPGRLRRNNHYELAECTISEAIPPGAARESRGTSSDERDQSADKCSFPEPSGDGRYGCELCCHGSSGANS